MPTYEFSAYLVVHGSDEDEARERAEAAQETIDDTSGGYVTLSLDDGPPIDTLED